MPLTHYPAIQSFLDYLKFEKRYSEHTIVSYKTDLEQFFSFLITRFDTPSIEQVTSGFIRSWLAELKSNKITSKSINRKISSLNSCFKFLIKHDVLQKTPMTTIVTPKVGKRLPAFVKQEDIKKLFEDIEFAEGWKGKTERLIILLFYNTGMRLSELVNLKESQVNFAYEQIKVLGKGNKERIIPLSKAVLKELENHIAGKPIRLEEVDNVFVNKKGKPLYHKYVYLIVKNYLGKVTTIQKKSPHILRHTFATHLMNNGAELNAVKELLGHASLAATQIYTHNTIEKLKEVFKNAHPKA